MLVIARTDARGPLGLDEAIRRANQYAAAGADILFVEAPESEAEIERIGAEVRAPLLLDLVIGGRTPEQSAARLQELGFAVAIHPSAVLAHAALGALTALCQLRGIKEDPFLPSRPEEFFDLVGMREWTAIGDKFQPANGA